MFRMTSKVITLTQKKQIEQAVVVLKKDGVVAYPTDTVYGLGAAMNNLNAVERIFEVKGRPKGMALPLLAADREQIRKIAKNIPETAWQLIDKFMPGGLTIILQKADNVADIITGGSKTIGVRIPNHPIPIALIKGLGQPIVGTSANLSGQPSALTAEEVARQIGDRVDMIIDGGRSPGGVESTVVNLSGEKPKIIRVGAISPEEIKLICPDIEVAGGKP